MSADGSGLPEHHLPYLYSRLKGDNTPEEHAGLLREIHDASDYLVDRAFRDGYQASPLYELALRVRHRVFDPNQFLNNESRLLYALSYDITRELHAHIAERHKYNGNVVLEFAGPTGTGKSSCMLGLMERHNGLRTRVLNEGPRALTKRLSVDLQELPEKLKGLASGDAVCMDEQFHLMGEGAETRIKQMRNLEDTLRGTGIDIYYVSPGARDNHDASQGLLWAIPWSPPILRDGSPGKLATRFLYFCSLYGEPAIPVGVVTLPWCSKETFAAYTPLKDAQLDRTRAGVFHNDARANEPIIKRLFEHPAVRAKIDALGKPNKGQLERMIQAHGPSMSGDEKLSLAAEIEDMLTIIRDKAEAFPTIYNWTPTQNMIDVAKLGKTTKTTSGGGITGF